MSQLGPRDRVHFPLPVQALALGMDIRDDFISSFGLPTSQLSSQQLIKFWNAGIRKLIVVCGCLLVRI